MSSDARSSRRESVNITTQANTCHELKLKVNKAGVSALSVTSTGWQSPTLVEATEAESFVTVENETAGSLLADGSALKTALASAGQDSPIKVMITGEISDQDLANLKEHRQAFLEGVGHIDIIITNGVVSDQPQFRRMVDQLFVYREIEH